MKRIIFLGLAFLLNFSQLFAQQNRIFDFQKFKGSYKEGTIVVKLRTSSAKDEKNTSVNSVSLSSIAVELKALNITETKRPFFEKNKTTFSKEDLKYDLSNIYFLQIPKDKNIEESIRLLLQNKNVEYAEPYYIRKFFLTPNDPNAKPTSTFQYHLKLIKAYEAWDVQRGDTNMVIGIIDSGVLPTHPDLMGNLQYNYTDPVNGIDDDNDGYKDNYLGWDFSDNDNDVTADKSAHGTEVAGCSNAETNNAIGIAGTSFNMRFLPLKIFKSSTNEFWGGFDAIYYAANHGAKVINLSWGGEGGLQFEQDMINNIVLAKDVVVVAAAGNTPDELDFYPASYDNVLSVAATNSLDDKANFSTYSIHVDLAAPGDLIGTSDNSGGYGKYSGTSYSSPIVAGAAALVRRKFPKYNAAQVMEQLRITCDDIYSNLSNAPYFEKIGKGRLNMYRALTDSLNPSVRAKSVVINNGLADIAFYDDTVKVFCDFENYLKPAYNLKVTLTSSSPYVDIIQNSFTVDQLGTLETRDNSAAPFIIHLSPDTPDSQRVVLRLGFEGLGYHDFQYIEFYTAPDYLNTSYNSISFTSTSKGRIGYKDDNKSLGIGLLSGGHQFLGSGGIILAATPTQVSNNVVSNFQTGISDDNFTATRNIKLFKGSYADVETRGTMVDTINNPNKIGLVISQKQYGWKADTDSKFIILEYFVTNLSGITIPSLYAGLFTDLDVGSKMKNRASWDASNKMGYVSCSVPGYPMAGVTLLTSGDSSFFALDNAADNGTGVNTVDGFDQGEKYNTLANGIAKTEAGLIGEGTDVSQVLGLKIQNLGDKKSTKVGFAIVLGNSLEELQANAQRAKDQYEEFQMHPPVSITAYFCSNSSTTVSRANNLPFNLYESLPLDTPIYSGNSFQTPVLNENTTYYITNTEEGFESEPTKASVLKDDATADFIMDKDTLDLLYGNNITFTDITPNGIQRSWDFHNGYKSSNQTTIRIYNKQGIYNISLYAENRTGCKDTIEKQLVVISTSPKPEVSSIYICPNEVATIQPFNGTTFNFYDQFPLTTPIFTGQSLTTPALLNNASYWVTNIDSAKESEPTEVKINIWKNFAQFNLSADTINLDETKNIVVKDSTEGAINWKWLGVNKMVEGVNESTFEFNKTGIFPITLIVTNLSGCSDTLAKNIVALRKSPAPAAQNLSICTNSSATIRLENNNSFRLYDSLPLTQPLYEGNTFTTEKLNKNKTYYITSIDSLLESDPAEVIIQVTYPKADFTMSTDTLDLSKTDSVSFNAISEGITSWSWNFGNGRTEEAQASTTTFESIGIYSIKLITENSLGCQDSITKELVVTKSENPFPGLISIYPNPTEKDIVIHSFFSPYEPLDIVVYNYRNEKILEVGKIKTYGKPIRIESSNLPAGLYYLKVQSSSQSILKKVILY